MAGSKGKRGGQGSASVAPVTPAAPKQKTPEDIVNEAIGTQGSPKAIADAIQGNPNYSKGREWQTNCQRCVWATELRRRGYDVEALPRTSDDSYAKIDPNVPNSFINVAEGGLTLHQVVSPYYSSTATEFKDHFLRHYDVGMRGMITAQSGKSGHVFNWEIVQDKKGNKQVRFYDGQPGKDNVSVTSIKKKWFYFREARIDNVKISPLIKDFVKPKG